MATSDSADDPSTRNHWPDLPPELLGSVLQRLPVADYIVFGAVCVSWNSVFKQKFWLPARQPPWLVMLGKNGPHSICLSDHNKTHKLHLPVAEGVHCVGSKDGWLVFVDSKAKICLVNPLNRSLQVALPSIATAFSERRGVIRDRAGQITHRWFREGPVTNRYYSMRQPNKISIICCYKFFMSAAPSSGRCVVVAIHIFSKKLAFAKPGDKSWTVLDTPLQLFCHAIFYKGSLYVVTCYGGLVIYDPIDASSSSPKFATAVIGYEPRPQMMYLAELSGDLLRLVRYVDSVIKTHIFRVFKLEPTTYDWKEVKSLGDYALYVGYYNRSMALSAKDFPELRRNCIYFMNDHPNVSYPNREASGDFGVYDLEDGSVQPCFPCDSASTFLPPTWLEPSLY